MNKAGFWLLAGMIMNAPHNSLIVGSVIGVIYTLVGFYLLFKEKQL